MSEQSEKEPTMVKEVIFNSEKDKLINAMEKKIKSIEMNEVWDLIKLRT